MWLVFIFALELGYCPIGYSDPYNDIRLNGSNTFYLQMEAEVEIFEHIFIGGEMSTHMAYVESVKNFNPATLESMFYVGLRFGIVDIGFRHYCEHPVIAWMHNIGDYRASDTAYEELYIRIEGEIK